MKLSLGAELSRKFRSTASYLQNFILKAQNLKAQTSVSHTTFLS